MLVQLRIRWASIGPALGQRLVFAGMCAYTRRPTAQAKYGDALTRTE